MKTDVTKMPLQPPYEGLNKVLKREEHSFSLDVGGKPKAISLDRLMPFLQEADDTEKKRKRPISFDVRQSIATELIQS